ncbi:unnamed protein product [Phaeothamnion confervicola]
MHRVFWARIKTALLPPPHIATVTDVLPGTRVQARYGSPSGAFYGATVLRVRRPAAAANSPGGGGGGAGAGDDGGAGAGDDAVFDVRYDEDGVEEAGLPFARLRTRSDPPDYEPLLTLVGEVREKLAAAAPLPLPPTPLSSESGAAAGAAAVEDDAGHAAVRRAHAALDPDALRAALVHGGIGVGRTAELVRVAVAALLEIQAPARAEATRGWLRDFEAAAAAAEREGGEAVVALLPGAFEFIFTRIEELQRDTFNARLRLLAPFLAHHGIEYECEKFNNALAAGQTSLANTTAWLDAAVGASLARRRAPAPSPTAAAASAAFGAALVMGREGAHRELLAEAFVALLQRPVRLDGPPAAARLPETLAMDASRLAAARDAYDSVALTATMTVLLRQVLARMRVPCPPEPLHALRARLGALLQAGSVSLAALSGAVMAAAEQACAAHGGSALPREEAQRLSNLLASSADPNNEVFKVFFARVGAVIHAALLNKGVASQCAKSGLGDFEPEMMALCDSLRRLFRHNVAVHAAHYAAIIKAVATAATTSDAGTARTP